MTAEPDAPRMRATKEQLRILEAAMRRGHGWLPRACGPPEHGHLSARIFLAGFMGSGKSTVGSMLAARLRWRFVDLDTAIVEHSGVAIPEIFERYGEGHFRVVEHERLLAIAAGPERVVVALGGGTFVGETNRALIAARGASVWLDVPFRVIGQRIRFGADRPLALSRDQLRRLYRSRLPFYHEADLRVRAGAAPPGAVARSLLRLLREDWPVIAERRRLQL